MFVKKLAKIWTKKKIIFFYIIFLPRNIIFKLFSRFFDKKIIKVIDKVNDSNKDMVNKKKGDTCLVSSFFVGNSDRLEMLKLTVDKSLENFIDSKVKMYVRDSSSSEYSNKNENIFKGKGLDLDYQSEKKKLTESYYKLFSSMDEKYACTVFDDQPIVNLSPAFLNSATGLLTDFDGVIDMILVEWISKYIIDESNKTIKISLEDLEFKDKNIKPLGVVKYGDYSFAILKNYHFGFFFNNMFINAKSYANRLHWFMKYIDYFSPHALEMAGLYKIGPVFRYIAVPLEVGMLDIDYLHTDISTRETNQTAKALYDCVLKGFNIKCN